MANGKYSYQLYRGKYHIHVRLDDGRDMPASGEMCYRFKNDAKRRVYELNGWTWKD